MESSLCSVADVKQFTGTTGSQLDTLIALNIIAASDYLQRVTNRQWAASSNTLTFTTNGRAYLTIPDLLVATDVTLNGTSLVANASYWLIPDSRGEGVYTGIQLRSFGALYNKAGGPWYLGDPNWFDKGLDLPYAYSPGNIGPYGLHVSMPNDLAITGGWGWPYVPTAARIATAELAGWMTKRKDALLANVNQTPEGNTLLYDVLPPDVKTFIAEWRLGQQIDLA